jgi:uncharacterized protein YlzI (FlbEa/FlbD family)
MASIKRKNYGVEIVDNEGHIFLFPLNSIILAAEEKSDMVNIKIKSYRRTIMSLNYKTFTEPTADNVEDFVKITEKIIYDI